MLLQWEKNLELGVTDIDKEHKELILKANLLFESMKNGTSQSEIIKLLEFLAEYTVTHFNNEEAMQKKSRYPEYNNHKTIHNDFKKQVIELIDLVKKEGLSPTKKIEINRLTIDWLKNHIGVEDKKFAEYYKSTL